MEQIRLNIRNTVFEVKKSLLCEHSDYFKAMFNGKYVEDKQKEVSINVVDPQIMRIILQYMNTTLIDISEYSFTTVCEILIVANFLQITKLLKHIEYCLHKQVCCKNWMDIMDTAETFLFTKLVQFCSMFGLYGFGSMQPQHVPTIFKLVWYLSHPNLNAESELAVFNFGLQWFLNNDIGADVLLVILGCLDFKRMTHQDIHIIKKSIIEFDGSLAFYVVNCFCDLTNDGLPISEAILVEHKTLVCRKYSKRVWTEAINIIKGSTSRLLHYTPVLPMQKREDDFKNVVPQYIYTFENDRGFEQWLNVEESKWGWNVISWGPTKLVIVSCEQANSSGICVRDIKVYDTLWKQWTRHGVDLPARSLAGLTIVGDSLFIIGGMGDGLCCLALKTALVYNLNERSFKVLPDLPEGLLHPAVCSHKGAVYVAGKRNIYCYEESGTMGCWRSVIASDIRMRCIISYKDHIYCMQRSQDHLFRFRPDVDQSIEIVTSFHYPPATLLNTGEGLLIITSKDYIAVEEFQEDTKTTDVIHTSLNSSLKLNMVAGFCTAALRIPPVRKEVSEYHKSYLKRYSDSNPKSTSIITEVHEILRQCAMMKLLYKPVLR